MNIMTEKEAAEKWCPEVRLQVVTLERGTDPYTDESRNAMIGLSSTAVNRIVDDKGQRRIAKHTTCIAGECMMWRWSGVPLADDDGSNKEKAGFCGLSNHGGPFMVYLPESDKPRVINRRDEL